MPQHCGTLSLRFMEDATFAYCGDSLAERRAAALAWHAGAVGPIPRVDDIPLRAGDVALLTGLTHDVDKNHRLVVLGEVLPSGRHQTWFTRAVHHHPGWVRGDPCGLIVPTKMRFVWRGDLPEQLLDNVVQLLAPTMASLIPYYDWCFKAPPPTVVMPQASLAPSTRTHSPLRSGVHTYRSLSIHLRVVQGLAAIRA